ncbi:MAG: molybdopterin converting factor subunit 1 [Pseudomonadota bacterium]
MQVLYFAWLRERIGKGSETVDPPADVATPAALIDWLKTREERYAAALQDVSAVKVAIDQKQADMTTSLAGAREVAFFPPVTGG